MRGMSASSGTTTAAPGTASAGRRWTAALARAVGPLALGAALAGCGAASAADDMPVPAAEPAAPANHEQVAGMCPVGVTDCVDTTVDEVGDDQPVAREREAARALLGTGEGELPADVRIARRGGEQMMLTEDYVLGRRTVALDARPDGAMVVTEVTVELPGGPETFFTS